MHFPRNINEFPNAIGTPAQREHWLKMLISAFIILHVSLTIAFLSPESIALRQAITDATGFFWKFSGMYQGWQLFAPAIRNFNSHSIVLLSFEDGSTTEWPLARTDQMGYWEKYQRDKFRKWNGDNIQSDRHKEDWPDFAKYVGRLHYDGTGPKPVSFMLMRFSSTIPKPESGHKRLEMPPRTTPQMLFFYTYRPEDFSI